MVQRVQRGSIGSSFVGKDPDPKVTEAWLLLKLRLLVKCGPKLLPVRSLDEIALLERSIEDKQCDI